MPHLTAEQLAAWRGALYRSEPLVLDPAIVRRLLDEVEQLQGELADARVTFATRAAAALEKRPTDVASIGRCRTCRDAEARAFLAKLRRIVAGET